MGKQENENENNGNQNQEAPVVEIKKVKFLDKHPNVKKIGKIVAKAAVATAGTVAAVCAGLAIWDSNRTYYTITMAELPDKTTGTYSYEAEVKPTEET